MIFGFPMLNRIEKEAIEFEAKLVIIDNISKLLPDPLKPDNASCVVDVLNRIRLKTGASILVIGHTTKGNPKVCIQPTDYYGSAMLQNFFHELFFIDKTKDGKYFFCHSKTKHKKISELNVPVFSFSDQTRFGLGFEYISLQALSEIQLSEKLITPVIHRPRNLSDFKPQIISLMDSGYSQSDIARFANVSPSAIYQTLRAA